MSDEIPLFDSHGGATLDGTWLGGRAGLTVAALRAQMTGAGFMGGLVQGLPGVSGYEHEAFAAAVKREKALFPVAAWNGTPEESSAAHLARLKTLGFAGIHAHPRLAGVGPDKAPFATLMRTAGQADFPVFFCSYQFADASAGLPTDPLPALSDALRQAPGARLVLLHGGTVEVLRYAEFCRANPRVLLDLSFTMMRYAGSSVDLDLNYICRTLDRRICIGTDAPEFSHAEVRTRFDALTGALPREKRVNIAGRSLTRFLGLDLYPAGD